MAASFIQGVQSQQVGTSIKHFYANNQEHRRMSSSSEMNARTAREIYLAAFERPIRKAKPWTVMCAYNRINGVYAAENKEALTDILRGEWNFHGFVVSDWGAVNDRVADLESGMDLENALLFRHAGCRNRQGGSLRQTAGSRTGQSRHPYPANCPAVSGRTES